MQNTHRDIAKQASIDAYQQLLTNTFLTLFNNLVASQGEADTHDAREKAQKGIAIAMKAYQEAQFIIETLPMDVLR